MVALAPGIILASTINWDMWAVAFLALAMLAFSRERTFLAGVLIGLGTAMKVFPLLFFGAVIVLAIRTGRYRPLGVSLGGAAASWLAVNLPFALVNFDGVEALLHLHRGPRGRAVLLLAHLERHRRRRAGDAGS